ncbi:hypothetical protein AMJ57_01075 [Parcubacteria bacterium SG8_24]|nr:MAG: hypothetical protein AMJ57_01075 [Parcubacteria bacterium SG8_24]
MILAVVLAIVGFGAGYILGGAMKYEKGYQAGQQAAESSVQEKLIATGLVPEAVFEDTPVMAVSGEVTEVGSAYIMVRARMQMDVLSEPEQRDLRVEIGKDTVIRIRRELTPEEMSAADLEYSRQVEEYQAEMAAATPEEAALIQLPPPPAPFRYETISLDDIEIGKVVTVGSATDLRQATSFTAVTIDMFVPAELPEPDDIVEIVPTGPPVEEPLPEEPLMPEGEEMPME